MCAFVCSQSAVDAIRSLSARGAWGGDPAWPESPRALPLWGDCVCSQRSFAEFTRENDPSVLEGLFPPVDLLVPSSRFRSSGKSAKFHVWSREIPAGACRRLSERLVISGPEFAIVQLAGSLGKFDSLFDGFMVELREQKELLASVGQEGEFVAELPQKWEQIRRLAALASLACEFAGTYRLAVGTLALSESGLAKKNCAPESSGAGVPGLSAAGAQRPGAGAPLPPLLLAEASLLAWAPVMSVSSLCEFSARACRGPAAWRAQRIAELAPRRLGLPDGDRFGAPFDDARRIGRFRDIEATAQRDDLWRGTLFFVRPDLGHV